MLPAFVYYRAFTDVADRVLGDEGIRALENALAANPAYGTSLGCGLYKGRVARPGADKRGGLRFIYYRAPSGRVWMLYAFPKNERGNITDKERRALCDIVKGLE